LTAHGEGVAEGARLDRPEHLVGLDRERVEGLGEEAPDRRRQDDVEDLGVGQPVRAEPLDVVARDRGGVGRDLVGEVDDGTVDGRELCPIMIFASLVSALIVRRTSTGSASCTGSRTNMVDTWLVPSDSDLPCTDTGTEQTSGSPGRSSWASR
jgi:hypothetical protein